MLVYLVLPLCLGWVVIISYIVDTCKEVVVTHAELADKAGVVRLR